MFPFATFFGPAIFDATAALSLNVAGPSTTPVLSSLGIIANDLAIVICNIGPPSGGGWTQLTITGAGSPSGVWWKKLASGDLSSGLSLTLGTNINWQLLIMRGAVSLNSISVTNSTVSPATLPGYTRNVNHAGTIIIVAAVDLGGYGITNFTKAGNTGTLGTPSNELGIFYLPVPPQNPYTSGATFTATYSGGGGSARYRILIAELRR